MHRTERKLRRNNDTIVYNYCRLIYAQPLSGQMSFTKGITARFIFRNNDNPVGGPHEAAAEADVVLIPAGFSLEFPKQPVQGGVGGNPWISVRFLNGNGEPVGTETLLGRCVQLLPGN